jgi:hypothetical protein
MGDRRMHGVSPALRSIDRDVVQRVIGNRLDRLAGKSLGVVHRRSSIQSDHWVQFDSGQGPFPNRSPLVCTENLSSSVVVVKPAKNGV